MYKLIKNFIICVCILSFIPVTVYAQDTYNNLFDNSQTVQAKEYKQKFWDVEKKHWAFEAIAELAERGAINGYDDGSYKPEKTVTRAEWAKIMITVAGLSANDYSVRFTDMNGHWSLPYVNAASAYLTAYNDNTYRPDQAVTREDVTMSMVKLKGYDLSEVDYSILSKFTDVASISNHIKVYVAIAVEKGLITGFDDNTFRGQATLTRAQAATLLWRAFQFGNDNKTTAESQKADISETPNTNASQKKDKNESKPSYQESETEILKSEEEQSFDNFDSENFEEDITDDDTYKNEPTKPYIISKVTSAVIDSFSNATLDKSGNLYYIDMEDGYVYKVDVKRKEKTEYFDCLDLELSGESDEIYSGFIPEQVFFDTINNKLLLKGQFTLLDKPGGYPEEVEYECIYDITNEKDKIYIELENNYSPSRNIQGVLNDEYLLIKRGESKLSKISVDTWNEEEINMVCDRHNAGSILIYGSEIYSFESNYFEDYIYKYDFSSNNYEKFFNTGGSASNMKVSIGKSFKAFGIKGDSFYGWCQDGEIHKISVKTAKPKELDANAKSENVEFADMGNLNNMDERFFVINDDTFVFYDKQMEAIRILEKS